VTDSESKARGGISVVESAPDRYQALGALTFATAARALAAGLAALAHTQGRSIEVDLAGVEAADSAGLAVLIEWAAWARRNGRSLRFTRVPDALRTIARISEIDELLFGG
jgi:phospholipid transport system transporter-binding protein